MGRANLSDRGSCFGRRLCCRVYSDRSVQERSSWFPPLLEGALAVPRQNWLATRSWRARRASLGARAASPGTLSPFSTSAFCNAKKHASLTGDAFSSVNLEREAGRFSLRVLACSRLLKKEKA